MKMAWAHGVPRMLAGVLGAGAVLWSLTAPAADPTSSGETRPAVSGKEIFEREWLPKDPRSHGGDGLGPMFNDTSCVACHNLGGVGGGGPANKNVEVASASVTMPNLPQAAPNSPGGITGFVQNVLLSASKTSQKARAEQLKKENEVLAKVHPGFASSRSLVLHHFGTDEKYAGWRTKLSIFGAGQQQQGMSFIQAAPSFEVATEVTEAEIGDDAVVTSVAPQARQVRIVQPQFISPPFPTRGGFGGPLTIFGNTVSQPEPMQPNMALLEARQAAAMRQTVSARTAFHENVVVLTTQRNATSIFGAGILDSIPEEAIEAAAKADHGDFKISGRVNRQADGRIGRFGWKAQKPTLHEFTMTACAVELGLHVPEHPQSGDPNKPEYKPTGFDLDDQECKALVQYLKELPAPKRNKAQSEAEEKIIANGSALFAKVGCAECHKETLGNAEGVYTDLLLHDMGPELADTGSYGVFIPDSPSESVPQEIPELTKADGEKPAQKKMLTVQPATNAEWRTAPLWGVRDSAPYLHDGRANTIEAAIAFHGGEGAQSADGFFKLSHDERQQVLAFMKTLVAP